MSVGPAIDTSPPGSDMTAWPAMVVGWGSESEVEVGGSANTEPPTRRSPAEPMENIFSETVAAAPLGINVVP